MALEARAWWFTRLFWIQFLWPHSLESQPSDWVGSIIISASCYLRFAGHHLYSQAISYLLSSPSSSTLAYLECPPQNPSELPLLPSVPRFSSKRCSQGPNGFTC